MDDVTKRVAQQYEKYVYPAPIADIGEWLGRNNYELSDPRFFSVQLWPEGRPRDDLRILSAGCGANQAAVLAHNNPGCSVVGIDISEASLANQQRLKDKHGLGNLELAHLDLHDVGKLGRAFDLIVSTGVLHHLPDPVAGLRALGSVMAPRAAMYLMLYGATKRAGLYLLQDVFRRLKLQQTPDGIAAVKEFLASLPDDHYAQNLIRISTDVAHDAGLVDLFLHPQDRAYTVPQVLDFVANGGLQFQCWSDNKLYYPDVLEKLTPNSRALLGALPEHEQWAVVENLHLKIGHQIFIVRRADEQSQQLSFSGADWPHYYPQHHPMLRVREPSSINPPKPATVHRMGVFELDPLSAYLYSEAKGNKTIRETVALLGDKADAVAAGFYPAMFRRGHLLFSKVPVAASS